MAIALIAQTTEAEKKTAVDKLIRSGSPDQDFFLLVILSVAMATVGLLQNSVTTVIGSMLVAPMLYPIVGTAMGMTIGDQKLMGRSLYTILISVIVALGTSCILTLVLNLFMPLEVTEQIAERGVLNAFNILVALIAGVAGSFALVKADIGESLPGTAIAVALVPPLAVVGIALALGEVSIMFNAARLFLINTIGIIFTSVIVFMALDFTSRTIKKEVKETLSEESKKLESENNTTATFKKKTDQIVDAIGHLKESRKKKEVEKE